MASHGNEHEAPAVSFSLPWDSGHSQLCPVASSQLHDSCWVSHTWGEDRTQHKEAYEAYLLPLFTQQPLLTEVLLGWGRRYCDRHVLVSQGPVWVQKCSTPRLPKNTYVVFSCLCTRQMLLRWLWQVEPESCTAMSDVLQSPHISMGTWEDLFPQMKLWRRIQLRQRGVQIQGLLLQHFMIWVSLKAMCNFLSDEFSPCSFTSDGQRCFTVINALLTCFLKNCPRYQVSLWQIPCFTLTSRAMSSL